MNILVIISDLHDGDLGSFWKLYRRGRYLDKKRKTLAYALRGHEIYSNNLWNPAQFLFFFVFSFFFLLLGFNKGSSRPSAIWGMPQIHTARGEKIRNKRSARAIPHPATHHHDLTGTLLSPAHTGVPAVATSTSNLAPTKSTNSSSPTTHRRILPVQPVLTQISLRLRV